MYAQRSRAPGECCDTTTSNGAICNNVTRFAARVCCIDNNIMHICDASSVMPMILLYPRDCTGTGSWYDLEGTIVGKLK